MPLASVGVFVLVVTTFWPALRCGFINFDDNLYVTANPQVRQGFSAAAVRWAMTTFHAGYWIPVTWLSLMFDAGPGELNAFRFHLTNVLLHALVAATLLVTLVRLTGSRWRSLIVTVLFAVHPLRVESVVWVVERKDLLSALFGLLAIFFYVSYTRARAYGAIWYALVVGCFALSLMSKTTLVTLPCLLLLLDVWPLQRLHVPGVEARGSASSAATSLTTAVGEKLPLLALSIAGSVITFVAQRQMGVVQGVTQFGWGGRIANALVAYVVYVRQTIWPSGLAVFYGLHPHLPFSQVLGCGSLLLLITGLCVWRLRKNAAPAIGWFWFLGTLVPMIGLVQVFDQAYADRFTYFPSIGLLIAAVWAVPEFESMSRPLRTLAAVAVIALTGILIVVTHNQIGFWQDSRTLFERDLQAAGPSAFGEYSLGEALARSGDLPGAIAHLEAALALKPGQGAIHDDLGQLLMARGNVAGALAHFRTALQLEPGNADVHNSLASALAASGDGPAAMREFQAALDLNPNLSAARINLGVMQLRAGDEHAADVQFQRVLSADPSNVDLPLNVARAYASVGSSAKAIDYYRKTLKLSPHREDIRAELEVVTRRGLTSGSKNIDPAAKQDGHHGQ